MHLVQVDFASGMRTHYPSGALQSAVWCCVVVFLLTSQNGTNNTEQTVSETDLGVTWGRSPPRVKWAATGIVSSLRPGAGFIFGGKTVAGLLSM